MSRANVKRGTCINRASRLSVAEANLHSGHALFTVERRLVQCSQGLGRDHGNVKNSARIRHDFCAAYSANEIQYV